MRQLGAKRLAEILWALSDGNTLLRRRLNLEVLGVQDLNELAKAIRRRIATIKRSKSRVTWKKIPDLATDLDMHLGAIALHLTPKEPEVALNLLWAFLQMSNNVLNRLNFGFDDIDLIFHAAVDLLGETAGKCTLDQSDTVDRTVQCMLENHFGQFNQLLEKVVPLLGDEAQNQLKDALHEQRNKYAADRSSTGLEYLGNVTIALQKMADLQGDVDAFIALIDEDLRTHSDFAVDIAVGIAQRLLKAERASEALDYLEAANEHPITQAWTDTYITALDAVGRHDDAQDARWTCFYDRRSRGHLRDYLKRLDNSAAFDAEEGALDLIADIPNPVEAMDFLFEWPDLRRAAELVIKRRNQFSSYYFEKTEASAERLETRFPLAATILLRILIDETLDERVYDRYRDAARVLKDCERLAANITDYRDVLPHDEYVKRIQIDHKLKYGFWNQVKQLD